MKPRNKRPARKLLITMNEYKEKEKDSEKFKEFKDLQAKANFWGE